MNLPRSVQEIADVVGEEKALFLIGKLPRCHTPGKSGRSWDSGKRVGAERVVMYVPKRLDLDHQLVRILGYVNAQKLVDAFGGEIMCPATCASIYKPFRDEHIVRVIQEGVPVNMAADWFQVSERHIKNLLREIPQEERAAANDDNGPIKTIAA
jgi:hypothetical protein